MQSCATLLVQRHIATNFQNRAGWWRNNWYIYYIGCKRDKKESQTFETNTSPYGNISFFAECSSTMLSFLSHDDTKFEDHFGGALLEA